LPVIPADSNIASVLSPIAGKYDQVSRYNSTTKQFQHYVNNTKYNQFDSFEYGRGYQVYITGSQDVSLSITGAAPTAPQSVSLKSNHS
jgi:hypothetical protein